MADTDDTKIANVIARAWTDSEFKARLHSDPRSALREMNVVLSGGVKISVIESDEENSFFILPPAPDGELSKEELTKKAQSYDYKALVHVLYNVCCC